MPDAAIRFGASVSLMFRELPLLARFAAARRAGFGAVEIQVLDEGDPRAMATAARAAEIPIHLVNVNLADFRAGGPALSGVPGREAAFRDAVAATLDAAAILGARFIHLGPSRIPSGRARQACLETYRHNLRFASERAVGYPATLVIEPLNTIDTPDILLSSVAEAAALIEETGGTIGIQYDLYHATLNGLDLVETYRQFHRWIRHIQFADAPGRHEPGTGGIDFSHVLTQLRAHGYRGWLGAEYLPSRPTVESLGWLPRFREIVAG